MQAVLDFVLPLLPHLVLLIFVVAGVIGSMLPGIPGAILILVGSLVHGLWTGWEPLGLWIQLTLVVLTALSGVVQYLITAFGAQRSGASRWGVVGASLGMIFGFFLPITPLLGAPVGAFLGALSFEYLATDKDATQLTRAGFGATLGAVLGMLAEAGVAIFMAGFIATVFLASWIF